MVKDKEQEESEIAQDILDQCQLITDGDSGQIFRYNNGVYKALTEKNIYHYIITEYQNNNLRYSRNKRNITLDFLISKSYMNTKILESSGKNSVNLKNGVYFFNKTFEQLEVNNDLVGTYKSHFKSHPISEYYSFTQINTNYDKNAKCPVIDKFVEDVFGIENALTIYEFIGYLLLPHVRYQRALIMIGSGKNGKTTFLDMIEHFLGSENISHIALQDLDDKFSPYNLKNIMGNIVSDLPSKELKDTGNAKMIVTDKTLSGSIKNVQGDFSFDNRCKMLYSVNELPRTKDKTVAFYRRWIMMICDRVFEKDKDINIFDKITTKEEMSGLFNRALEGIQRLETNKGFPDTVMEVKELWELETNPISVFISNYCSRTVGAEIKSRDLFNAFNIYRSQKKMSIFDYRKIGYWLRQYGIIGIQRPDKDDLDKYGNAKWYTFYQDLELIDNALQPLEDNLTEWMIGK